MKYTVGISEIVLWTADKEQALRFYRDLLGLEVISPSTLPNVFHHSCTRYANTTR